MRESSSNGHDPILAEVRQAREALAKRFDGDLRKIAAYLNEQTRKEGRQVVSFPPRRPANGTVDTPRAA
jgi:hypothetical protein